MEKYFKMSTENFTQSAKRWKLPFYSEPWIFLGHFLILNLDGGLDRNLILK